MPTTKQQAIYTYIDDTGDAQNLQTIRDSLLAKAIFEQVILATTTEDQEQKALAKSLKTINNMRVNEKALDSLQKYFDEFTAKSFIQPDMRKINRLRNETDLYKLWIYHAITQINYVTPATHVAKLTHSSSGGSSVIDNISDTKEGLLTTSGLPSFDYDGAYPNASLSKIAKFLLIPIEDKPLGVWLKVGNATPLEGIFSNDELGEIMPDFEKRLNPKPKADSLSKQVYFPVEDDYHLLIVMKSSAMIGEVYNRYFAKDVRKTQEDAKKAYDKGKYHADILLATPNTLVLSTVMSQPQNVSVNNGSRGGNIRLFNATPPIWQSQDKIPTYTNLFNSRQLAYLAGDNLTGLKEFLLVFHKAGISFKEPKRLKGVENWVKAIADNVIDFIQGFARFQVGWTADSAVKLVDYQKTLLDFYRQDADFIEQKNNTDWQALVVKDFARFVNINIRDEAQGFIATSEHSRVWREIFANVLREYVDVLVYKARLSQLQGGH